MLGPLRRSTSSGLFWSSGFVMGHRTGSPLPSAGPGPAAPHRGWLGQMPAEGGRHGCLGLGSKAGVMPAPDAISAGDRALPGKRRAS